MRGLHVILLDADPQGSSLDWTQRRGQQGLPVCSAPWACPRNRIQKLARRADHIIIDGPPHAAHRSALLAAERVLIPDAAQPYDVWASAEWSRSAKHRCSGQRCATASTTARRHHHHRQGRHGNRCSRCPRCARRSSASSSDSVAAGRLARKPRPTAPLPRDRRAHRRTAAVADMTEATTTQQARRHRCIPRQSARRSVDSPGRLQMPCRKRHSLD